MGINKGAAETALEWIKQVITLASGIVALSATFLDKLSSHPSYALVILMVSWACFIASIMTGLETISIIVKSNLDENDEWSKDPGLIYAKACKLLFIIGFIIFCIFATISFIESNQ